MSRSAAGSLAIIAGLTLVAVGVAAAVPAQSDFSGGEVITQRTLRAYLSFIAADELEGRATPSRGLKIAARFLASHMERLGLEPAGDDGTYFQRIPLQRQRVDAGATRARVGDLELEYGRDFVAGEAGVGDAAGPLVYVGHGWYAPADGIDPYAGLDVADKLLVVRGGGIPDGIDRERLRRGRRGEDWMSPFDYARRHGARGIVSLPTPAVLASWDEMRRRESEQGTVELFGAEGGRAAAALPAIAVSTRVAGLLFDGERLSAAEILGAAGPGPSFALRGTLNASFGVVLAQDATYTQNVVALLPGADPQTGGEHVAYGAHYDHVGIGGADESGDRIYNGADDDGSGTVALMAIAEAFVRGPRPRRSLLFVWHAGEEGGLWGSRHFTDNPVVPIETIVAQINIDMIGRSRPPGDRNPRNERLTAADEVYTIGPRIMSADLQEILERVNESYLGLRLNPLYDDRNQRERFFYRSDHYNYAQRGIPVLFLFSGAHEDYHRPSDHVERIDFDKMTSIARTAWAIGRELAEADQRPGVNPDFQR